MKTESTYLKANEVLPRLNAVRFFVVLLIAFGYASTMSIGPDSQETSVFFGYEPSWIGIQLLFFFSGALAYRSLLSGRSRLDYLKSRIGRVFPLLLAITLTTVFVIYPLLGKPLSSPQDYLALAKYFFLTVTCIEPGQPLPGLLDDALYMCLIQGAIWTLRWGLLLHLSVILASKVPALLKPRVLLFGACGATLIYAATVFIATKLSLEPLRTPLIGMRLGYIFLIGMAIWAYRNQLPKSRLHQALIGGSLFAFAALNYAFFPWTPVIEITLTLSLAYGAWLSATSTTRLLSILQNWPHLVLGLYLLNWPTSQVLLHEFPELDRWTLPAVSMPLTIVLSLLSYWALTGRINRLIKLSLARKVTV